MTDQLGLQLKNAFGENLPQQWWLLKSEPETYSIDTLAREKKTWWNGVRNYQVRNSMRDQMKVGDGGLFYHSSCPRPGLVGICRIAAAARPDDSALDSKSPYSDEKAIKSGVNPWLMVQVELVYQFSQAQQERLSLASLRELAKNDPVIASLILLRPGNRLSITAVEIDQFNKMRTFLR